MPKYKASLAKRGSVKIAPLTARKITVSKINRVAPPRRPTSNTITPRRVRSAGDAIGASHQSFFDIGKFLSGK